jgi:hypothetical protein
LGRVLDGFGRPLDGGPPIEAEAFYDLHAAPPGPLQRRHITRPLTIGIRAIDSLLPCGEGQRIGIFGGEARGNTVFGNTIGISLGFGLADGNRVFNNATGIAATSTSFVQNNQVYSNTNGIVGDNSPNNAARRKSRLAKELDAAQKAISSQNALYGAGQIGQQPTAGHVELTFPVVTQQPYTEPEGYENIILRGGPGEAAIVADRMIQELENAQRRGKLGAGDIMAGFDKLNRMTYAEATKLASHPVSCIDCHDPETLQLRVTRPGFLEGIRALKASEGVKDYDVNKMATRQEMRAFVCGQCHVESRQRAGGLSAGVLLHDHAGQASLRQSQRGEGLLRTGAWLMEFLASAAK